MKTNRDRQNRLALAENAISEAIDLLYTPGTGYKVEDEAKRNLRAVRATLTLKRADLIQESVNLPR